MQPIDDAHRSLTRFVDGIAELGPARDAIAAHCRRTLPSELVEDVVLVASELMTNAIRHGTTGNAEVDVAVTGPRATVTVTSTGNATDVAHPSRWRYPGPTQVDGRGLPLVKALSESIRLDVSGDAGQHLAITAVLGADLLGGESS